ncbi:SNF2 family N-terminal domain-containing protein [Cubamyces menziesii]|nr:SNF2 family N-terminal domain-containing protein [Cubamyces menziesii]
MSEPPNPPKTQRKSRILAALDNPSFLSPNPNPATLPPVPLGVPQLPPTPGKRRLEKDVPDFDYLGVLENLPLTQSLRRVLEHENDYGEASGSSPRALGVTRDFGLRYDQETAVRSIDKGGSDQQARMQEFVNQSIEDAANRITVKEAMAKLGLKEIKDLIPGMEVRLLPHQLIGVSWMVEQERTSPHKGGILADDMGLGKTVQMIATMVVNQPTKEDKHRTTLIVVPAALMQQWKEEVEQKTNDMFKVHIQHGRDKIKDPELLTEYDVVITTYQTLNLDFSAPDDLDSGEEMNWLRMHGGVLSRTRFYRVVLDEAQFIRNRGTRASKAVAMLRAKYRWCLTGTPITNTLADIYGYLRFGRFRPWNDWDDFNEFIAKVQLTDAPLAGLRAQEVLKPIIFRRTKNATIEGEPILKLPEKHVELVFVDFSPDEREIYDHMEKRAQIQINRFIRNNSLLKNHQQVFVWILRLRQLCDHPHLVLEQGEGFADPSMIMASADEKELSRATKKMGARWVMNIKQRFLKRARAEQLDFAGDVDEDENTCPMCGDFLLPNNSRILACGHEMCQDCLDVLASSRIEAREEFGNNDEQTNLRIEKEWENAAAKGLRPCPTCKKMQELTPNSVFLASAFQPTPEELIAANRAARSRGPPPPKKRKVEEVITLSAASSSDSDSDLPDLSQLLRSSPKDKSASGSKKVAVKSKAKGKKASSSDMEDDSDTDSPFGKGQTKAKGKASAKGKGKGKEKENNGDPGQPNEAMLKMWRQGGTNVESSAKMLQMVEYLKEWESTGDKTIVFSQWTSMLNLCEEIFARHGIRSLRYDGQMSREAREYTLAQFREPGGPKVILVSIKCGGVGLNLVSANRVINMDLAWNFATESQAYDRVHRLGQEKEVYVKRLVIRNSIEERMLKLQETKTHLADAALGEGTGTKLHKLSVKQIKDLFGLSRLNQRADDPNQTRLDQPAY